jgi:ribosomal protein S18 acetylase RimI-like enzyme
VTPFPGSPLLVAKAQPIDERIDDFYFGDEPWAKEVEESFKSRSWAKRRDLYVYSLDEAWVGGVRLGIFRLQHPHPGSSDVAKYLVIRDLGVNVSFQRQKCPDSDDRTFASVMLDDVERRARSNPECVGESLYVREPNIRARRLYEKHGFDYENGVFEQDGLPTLEMRRRFS